MKNFLLFALLATFLYSCKDDDPDPGEPIIPEPESPVVFDINQVPYPNLSDYNFFTAPMRELAPVYGVIPFEPINQLHTDYALKKRFVWMPDGSTATYVNDNVPFNFPDGAVMIKNFYYDNVLPTNSTKIIETRLMIRKNAEWIFANYIWNEEQTEATLDLGAQYIPITWMREGEQLSTTYQVPAESECLTCHKVEDNPILIGVKPRNLNAVFAYEDGIMNQIEKWKDFGYLSEQGLPAEIAATPNWTDTNLTLEERVRAYADINCAHCHKELAHCSYRPVRLAWEESGTDNNLGICIENSSAVQNSEVIIQPGRAERSAMYIRFLSTDVSIQMPFIGRTLVHEEAAELIGEWINSMEIVNCN